MAWTSVLSRVLPVVLLLALGVGVRRSGFLSGPAVDGLRKLVVNIALPALLFIAFLNTDFRSSHLWIVLLIFALNLLMLLLGKALNMFVARGNPYFPLLFTGFEMGMLGFSLFGTAFGLQSLGTMGIFDLGQEAYVWFVLTALLAGLKNGTSSLAGIVRSFATSPVIIGILCGVAVNVLGFRSALVSSPLLGGVFTAVTMVSQLTIPLILVIIGYQLNLRLAEFRLPLLTIVLRMSLLLVLALLLNHLVLVRLLHLPRLFSAAFFTMIILPPPFIIPLFMDERDAGNRGYVGNALSLATLVTLAGFTVLVIVFG